METELLLPDIDDPNFQAFWAGTARGELRIQTCADCRRKRFPPRPMCFACNSLRHEWVPVEGRGTIWSFVVPHPPLLPAYAALAPYNVIVVALASEPGLRVVGNLVAGVGGRINQIDPATIRIGEPVRVVFEQIGGVFLPRWVRA
ncbi:MAG: Zn-ribbon domain-containing OB-fold protein [Candidatus Binatia bacterium]